MTDYAVERQLLYSHMATQTTGLGVHYENFKFDQPSANGWLTMFIRGITANKASVGAARNFRRFTGLVQIDIYVPEKTGIATLRGHADTLGTLWDSKTLTGSGNVLITRTPNYTELGTQDGWFRGTLTVNYRRDKLS